MPLEVCIDSPKSAVECLLGGANRLEICNELSVGGLTPSIGFFETVKNITRSSKIQHRVMIRPRAGNFIYDEFEIDTMCADIKILKSRGALGFVFGCLNPDYTLNVVQLFRLLREAGGVPCTLHRCFDWTPDWRTALHTAAELGFDTVLTSGQQPTVRESIDTLQEMHLLSCEIEEYNGKKINIMAGSGLDEMSLRELKRNTGISWFHGSASIPIERKELHFPPFPMGPQDSELRKVADHKLISLLRGIIDNKNGQNND